MRTESVLWTPPIGKPTLLSVASVNPLVSQIVVQTSTCFETFLPVKVISKTQSLKSGYTDSLVCARTMILECHSRTSHPCLQAHLIFEINCNGPCLSSSLLRSLAAHWLDVFRRPGAPRVPDLVWLGAWERERISRQPLIRAPPTVTSRGP